MSKAKSGKLPLGNADLQSNSSAASEDKLRLRCSQLQKTIRGHKSEMEDKEQEIIKLKSKVAQMAQLSKFRIEA